MANFGQFLAKMGKKRLEHFFSPLKALINCKVSEKVMKGIREKCEKPPFWEFWAKMANFGQFLAKMGKTGIFFKKELGTFSRAYKP